MLRCLSWICAVTLALIGASACGVNQNATQQLPHESAATAIPQPPTAFARPSTAPAGADTVAPAGSAPADATREVQEMPTNPTSAADQAGVERPTAATGAPGQLSIDQATELVKNDLATFLRADAGQIQVVGAASRTWPDKGLGCTRKGLYEPEQVPGYEITVSHAGATYLYHTDLQGQLIRCASLGKPIGPISR